ncbi:MAG TPA: aspartate carbamoyltransferase regulatory subunit [Bacteroidales bacterium]|jgi:aspartate carbamoyltransferase regulatory subunit|nr:aspartate carbamoyltransferase regulatory subunit [Bacteroidales bacterium]MDI9552722.1 aspartate carbamoyltransferase regulatory subunit [Bacteroidota bacterium]MZP65659.1 aspartate carbamoyltransferase regulatory subunit [Bacteroidales bacterium]NLK55495.1 aspartate carbamoyltransferase regulatory subunit [Bacteroidales bacterium]HNY51809.1 aspartate carbamoyltransferase regulatory subunit [Bacteroidales bacterium]
MKEPKQLSVSAIESGTVIDHIPAKTLFKVISILGLDHIDSQITFGTNLESKKLGRKAIIKISGKFFEDNDINRIALVAPEAKLNIIKDYEVVEKKVVEVPDAIVGIAKCMNPKCITNYEKVTTRFKVVSKKNVALKCHYCEKITNQENLQII